MNEEVRVGLHYTSLVHILVGVGILVILFLLYSAIKDIAEVKLSWRNVLRNKRRSLLTLLAVIFAFTGNVFLGNYFLDMFRGLRETTIRSQTGHIQLLKRDFLVYGSSSPAEYLIENYDDILQQVYNNPRLKELINLDMKELNYNGILTSSFGARSLIYKGRGVDSNQDKIVSAFDIFIEGTSLQEDIPDGLVLGAGLAQQLQVGKDDIVTVQGTTYDGGLNVLDGQVVGIVRPFSKEYGNVILKSNLEFAQEMIGSRGINKIIFLLNDTYDTLEAKELLKDIVKQHPEWDLEVHDWHDLQEFYTQVHAMFTKIYVVVSTLLFILVVFLVLNTMTMSIVERFSEFGTLRAIGLKKHKLISLILLEGIILGIIGTILGLVVTWGLGLFITSLKLPLPPPPGFSTGYPLALNIQLHEQGFLKLILFNFASVIGITAISAIIPSIRASKLSIIDALHHQ